VSARRTGTVSAVSGPTLSEAVSKRLLAQYGIRVPAEAVVATPPEAANAAERIGFPVAVKLCGEAITHKTERGLVRLGLGTAGAVEEAAGALLDAATPADGDVAILVAPMVYGTRELIAGLARDPRVGMTVMLGVGGVLAEAIGDVVFRLVPITRVDAYDMIEDLRTQALLGTFRGEPPVDRDGLADTLMGLSALAAAVPAIASVDVNPLVVHDGVPVAVDALVELTG
jgi:acetyl-CoA synthetase (ADP-forming)